ncbi:MAG: hypothetical protein CL489_10910 [Acidobacteria bacterium]|nr:hypothetical protein [Acidobacteriota bacterium]|tara:strand:- start:1128 stop:1421 length:294 start_codon:yes stop_codon:yes gene_type:complete
MKVTEISTMQIVGRPNIIANSKLISSGRILKSENEKDLEDIKALLNSRFDCVTDKEAADKQNCLFVVLKKKEEPKEEKKTTTRKTSTRRTSKAKSGD